MTKRILFIFIWTFVFYFGAAILLGLISGFYFAASTSSGNPPSHQTISWVGKSWAVVPMASGLISLVLGILQFLPGTRRKNP